MTMTKQDTELLQPGEQDFGDDNLTYLSLPSNKPHSHPHVQYTDMMLQYCASMNLTNNSKIEILFSV